MFEMKDFILLGLSAAAVVWYIAHCIRNGENFLFYYEEEKDE